ncbi:MAG: D-alanyl-D-alanine carboxypeptidase family protein [Rhodospirillales bacterium]
MTSRFRRPALRARCLLLFGLAACLLVLMTATSSPTLAATAKKAPAAAPAPAATAQPAAGTMTTPAREAILIDATTGAVLYEKDPDVRMPPASMSKMMTAYILFQHLRDGQLKLTDTLPVSENAWRTGGSASGGSTMFLNLGDHVAVEDLIRGIIIQSGNDASIVVAEGLAGSETAFAELMTKVAREIGMTSTTFRNATGLPDPEEMTTVRDLATLAKRTIADFPEYYHYYSERDFVHGGIKQGNRNPLLYRNIGADGLKTGHTQAAGYCLTASAVQGGRRLILVVTGLPSMQARSEESERLIAYGFREFDSYALFKAGEEVTTGSVWLGTADTVPIVAPGDIAVTLPRKARPEMKATVAFDAPIPAPIAKGAPVAKLVVTAPGVAAQEFPLVAGQAVEQKGFFGRIFAGIGHRLGNLF